VPERFIQDCVVCMPWKPPGIRSAPPFRPPRPQFPAPRRATHRATGPRPGVSFESERRSTRIVCSKERPDYFVNQACVCFVVRRRMHYLASRFVVCNARTCPPSDHAESLVTSGVEHNIRGDIASLLVHELRSGALLTSTSTCGRRQQYCRFPLQPPF